METGTVTLTERKLWKLLNLVGILTTQCRMVRKELERLMGNILSMHIKVPGAVAHLYYIQLALAHMRKKPWFWHR